MNTVKTGSFISQLRKEKGLTQKQLADVLGVTDKAVSRWETAKNYPDIELLEQIAQFFVKNNINNFKINNLISYKIIRRCSVLYCNIF